MFNLGKKKEEQNIPFERRKFVRVRNILTVLCSNKNRSENLILYTDDISEGGFKGLSQVLLNPGEELHLIILLHSVHTRIEANGRVLRANKLKNNHFEVAVEFISISDNDRKKFADYIQTYATTV